MADIQEQTIINEIMDGQPEPYRFLVERYHKGVIQHLYNLVRDADLAEDIAQEAFIRAYEKITQYDPTYAFSTWLYKIADSIAYRQLKKTKPMVSLEDTASFMVDTKPTLAEATDQAITNETVRTAVDNLPFHYKQVVALYYWEGYSYEDISAIIEKPIGTVRTWLHRAKDQLRKELYGRL